MMEEASTLAVLRLVGGSISHLEGSTRAVEGKKIAIVGGGPGGLTLARLLQQSDAQISVYERDPSRSARVHCSALDLHEDSGLAALEAAGLIDAFWANHRPDLDGLRLTDAYGVVLHDHPRSHQPHRNRIADGRKYPDAVVEMASWRRCLSCSAFSLALSRRLGTLLRLGVMHRVLQVGGHVWLAKRVI